MALPIVRTAEIRVICTDRDTHPNREVGLLTVMIGDYDPEYRKRLEADEELSAEQARFLYDEQRVQYIRDREARRGGRVEGVRVNFSGRRNNAEINDPNYADPDDLYARGSLWRFVCPTCRRDVVMRGDRIRKLVDGLIHAGRVSVDLSYLPC